MYLYIGLLAGIIIILNYLSFNLPKYLPLSYYGFSTFKEVKAHLIDTYGFDNEVIGKMSLNKVMFILDLDHKASKIRSYKEMHKSIEEIQNSLEEYQQYHEGKLKETIETSNR